MKDKDVMPDRTFYSCVAGSFLGLGVSLTAIVELVQLIAALIAIGTSVYGFWHVFRKRNSRGRRRNK